MKLNKKLILTLTAGVVATTVAVGGIFAWFTSTATTGDPSTFHTAIVKLEVSSTDKSMNAFYPGHPTTIKAETELEEAITDLATGKLKPTADQELFNWWVNWNKAPGDNTVGSNWAFHSDHDGTNPNINPDTKVHWLLNPSGPNTYNTFNLVTPATFLYRSYGVTNSSNVPVYMRVKKAAFTATGPASADVTGLTQIANMVWMDGTDVPMYPFGDYFYCLNPIYPTGDAYGLNVKNILFHAYFAGIANGNDLQDSEITLLGGADATVELIQATNNAVYIADDVDPDVSWKAAAINFSTTDPASNGYGFLPYAPVTP